MPYRDPEKRKAFQAAYRAAHREENRAYQRQYRADHAEALREADRRRYQEQREERRLKLAASYREHREERRQRSREYYRTHSAAIKAATRAYGATHPEKMRAWRRTWKKRHPDATRAWGKARKAAMRGAAVRDFTAAQWEEMKRLYGDRCAYCGVEPAVLTQDHVIPVSRGGSHTASNIVPACQECNSRKGARPLSAHLAGGLPR